MNEKLLEPRMSPVRHCFFAALCFTAFATAETPEGYLRNVRPLLKTRCYPCHGALKQAGGLRLDAVEFIRKGGASGPGLVQGNPEESEILRRIRDADSDTRMPQEGKALTAEEIAMIQKWIAAGAPAPERDLPEPDPRKHWAFVPIQRPTPPSIRESAEFRNPIDALLEVERRRRGLQSSSLADPGTRLRRVYVDLTGLPPSPNQLREFLSHPTEDAFLKIVDQLLASPQYGERWGRHWMDVWRYSDWYGRRTVPDNLNSYGQMWRFRDWIVQSLNEDAGYDRMVMEMLAGDEIFPGDDRAAVATGFLLRNFFRWNYHQWMRDNVEHTAKAFLGLTMNCCQCHDHKYDPLTQLDYFRMRAIFEPIQVRHDRAPGEPDPGPFEKYVYAKSYKPIESGIARVFDEVPDAKTYMYAGGDERNRIPDAPPVEPGIPAVFSTARFTVAKVDLPESVWYPGRRRFIQSEEIDIRLKAVERAQAAVAAASKADAAAPASVTLQLAAALADLASIQSRIAADGASECPDESTRRTLREAASKSERLHRLAVAQQLHATAVEKRDDAKRQQKPATAVASLEAEVRNAAAKVEAARLEAGKVDVAYSPIGPVYPKQSSGRRAALARWIADKDNPLTARVAVNHMWARHFGRPIVETADNFGRNGSPPSHPELLDWLAAELIEGGWTMKRIHRLIVSSRAFAMRSGVEEICKNNLRLDPENRWLWRFPQRRLEAEAVRDALLACSGLLDLTPGGKEIPYERGQSVFRRSIYFAHHGEGSMPFLETFDVPSVCDAYRRTPSVVPQQALAMHNSELAAAAARALADRLWEQTAPEGTIESARTERMIDAAFFAILCRPPTDDERKLSRDYIHRVEHLLREHDEQRRRGAPALNLPNLDPALRARRDFIHSLFNHNDFICIR